ncbi:MAG TPA: VIT and VWA domain-containing protein [Fimbriimonadaceae bacterium]|nr:VIT and VWA domain-containing protein [Fimbriimonadaceae bacterium]
MLFVAAAVLLAGHVQGRWVPEVSPGSLLSSGNDVIVLPLKGTDVDADISGFGARVTVVQTFTNPSKAPIEAVYTFPLPADAAVDRMRMKVGDRIIDGVIKPRDEASAIYEAAKSHGQAAALLDQERPNIFTQSVANILPNSTVQIEISYVQILKYEDNQFEFSFPMVVGPRYLGNAPDPQKIAPPVIPEGMRTGSNISLTVNLDAGAPIVDVKSILHDVSVKEVGPTRATVTLKHKDEIPNRDFILHYRTATDSVQSAFLAKYDPVKGGFFSLILLPPKAPAAQQIANRELIFVIDQTGSQTGFPIAKSKELTLKLMDTMRPGDTFNVIGFTTGVNPLWKTSRANTPENRSEAADFVQGLDAGGGTDIRNAMEFAYSTPPNPGRLRLFIFNSDGYVGDEAEILQTVRKLHGDSRLFTFGIGNSVNRYLIDAMSEEGKGDSEIVTLDSDSDKAVARFVERTQSPILLNVSAKFEGVDVSDVLPSEIPDVFGSKPIVLYGRYGTPGEGKLTISGKMAGRPWSQTIDLLFPGDKPGGESIPTIWARRMIDKLERDYALGTRTAPNPAEGQTKITDLALEFGIMSQYTSFVAVEQRVINIGGQERTVHVPVDMASGVSYEGVGLGGPANLAQSTASFSVAGKNAGIGGGGFGGGGYGGATTGGVTLSGGQGAVPVTVDALAYEPEALAKPFANPDSIGTVTVETNDPGLQQFIMAMNRQDPKAVWSITRMKETILAKVTAKVRVLHAVFGSKEVHPEIIAKLLFESKVAAPLRRATGTLDVEVWLEDLEPSTLSSLKELGLTVDQPDKSLKLVFGRIDAKGLPGLAASGKVKRIEPVS